MGKAYKIMILIFKAIWVLRCLSFGICYTLRWEVELGIALTALWITFITFMMGEDAERDFEEIKNQNLEIIKLLKNKNKKNWTKPKTNKKI